jgi:hypothetical protein
MDPGNVMICYVMYQGCQLMEFGVTLLNFGPREPQLEVVSDNNYATDSNI